MKSDTTTNATSSPELAGGLSPCGGPALKACPESGQAPAPASLLAAPGEEMEPKTNATFGQSSETSSELADLPLFSASKSQALPLSERLGRALARRLARFGSMEFEATWSQRATPLGLRYWAHIPSARRTGGSGCTGWPTASARDWKDTPGMSETGVNPDGSKRMRLDMLPRVAQLASWPTPDTHKCGGPQDAEKRKAGGHHVRLQDAVMLAAWPTPNTMEGGQTSRGGKRKGEMLMGGLVGWATPRAEDAESAGMRHSRGVADTLSAQAGQDASRSNAETARPAGFQLNPRFSLWLMGYPDAWASCGERAMQSFRKSRRSS